MIGKVVSWGHKFIIVSTGEEVYRTVSNPYGDLTTRDGINLDNSVEFDVVNNRAINLKRVFFAPDMNTLRRNIHNIQIINENEQYSNELEGEGSLHYQDFGRINSILTTNENTLEVMLPIIKKIGLNLCQSENRPIRLTVMDCDKSVDVYDHSWNVGIVSTLTRVKDVEAEKKAWSEYNQFSYDLSNIYFKACFESFDIVKIQKKLYFGSPMSRRYNQFKYRSAKYAHAKI